MIGGMGVKLHVALHLRNCMYCIFAGDHVFIVCLLSARALFSDIPFLGVESDIVFHSLKTLVLEVWILSFRGIFVAQAFGSLLVTFYPLHVEQFGEPQNCRLLRVITVA